MQIMHILGPIGRYVLVLIFMGSVILNDVAGLGLETGDFLMLGAAAGVAGLEQVRGALGK